MKLFSYVNDEIVELEDASFLIDNKNELLILQKFISKCIQELDNNDSFDHMHLIDFMRQQEMDKTNMKDIIICK